MRVSALVLSVLLTGPALADGHLRPGVSFKDCETCPEMVVIPAGTFMMGSTEEETLLGQVRADAAAREQPKHAVTIAKPFAIGKYEVTIGEYRAFVEATNRPDPERCITWTEETDTWGPVEGASWQNAVFYQGENHPVGCLDLADARDFAVWLSETTGERYRVPSEAEWEYAARGATDMIQSWGNTMDEICSFANASDRTRADVHKGVWTTPTRFFDCRDGFVYTAPVGSFPPNAYGVHDMIGNIWEWTEDCFIVGYEGAPTDGSVWYEPDNCERLIVRGGGWYSRNWFMRPAGRSREPAEYRSTTLGLRVVREID